MSPVETSEIYDVEQIPLDLTSVLPPRSRGRDRARFVASFVFVVLLHMALFWLLERQTGADMPPVEEIIPVEIINELPAPDPEPQPEKQSEPEPQKPPQEFYEKPATDAPRASDQNKSGNKTQATPLDVPPQPKPVPEPAKEPPKVFDPWGLQGQLPELTFDTPAPKSNLPKGNADRTYLSIVYAQIMQKMDLPEEKLQYRHEALIKFGVDSKGQVFQSAIVVSSGNRILDNAALNAVRRASPLPAPPAGGPIYLTFSYGLR